MSMDAHFLFFYPELVDRSTGSFEIFFVAVGTVHGGYSRVIGKRLELDFLSQCWLIQWLLSSSPWSLATAASSCTSFVSPRGTTTEISGVMPISCTSLPLGVRYLKAVILIKPPTGPLWVL